MGPRSLQSERYRFGMDKVQARPVFESFWWRGSRVTTEAGVRYINFRDDNCCEDPSLVRGIQEGRIAAPPGFRPTGIRLRSALVATSTTATVLSSGLGT